MDRVQIETLLLILIWAVAGFAGISFLRSAFRDRAIRRNSRLAAVVDEVRFRFRLAFGLILLILVASGIYWMATNGVK